ncbi:hypothetical protein BJ742DRAFT_773178 [Cladochytrium replicatum]|nr:hypothetical protein BJ742DRAFT_773178 [Cladochytrium replicatum]
MEDPIGGAPINEIDFGVDEDLDDQTVDLFVEVLAQQLDSTLPYLPHNPRRLNDEVIQNNWTLYVPLIYSITDIYTMGMTVY